MAIRLQPTICHYLFGPAEPLARIRSGETVIAHTCADSPDDPLPASMKQHIPGVSLLLANPLVGPIYVEDAEEGDLLAVHIQRIRLDRSSGWSSQGPNFGSLTGEGPNHRLLYNQPIEPIRYTWKLDLERMLGILDMPESRLQQVAVPLQPFIGNIGVAPRYGRVETTMTPGEYGGNMDCIETGEGTTLYLPVWVRGAYLYFGDIHALQGDGELNGTAVEATAEVTLHIEVIKHHTADWPRLENATHIMVAGSTRPLLDCVRLAQMELLRWLVEEYGFQREEAWQLNAQVGTMRIGNIVDPLYTVVAKFPKQYLPDR